MDRRLAAAAVPPPGSDTVNNPLRSLWYRLALRGVDYTDRHDRMERLYRLADPWDMKGAREQHRFAETNRLLRAAFGDIGTLLEIGCGEGHQTQHLARVASDVTGIDVSRRAVARARLAVPDADFEVTQLSRSRLAQRKAPFDVVVAAEVLYYMRDVAAVLPQMERLGRGCFVTYYGDHAERLDALVDRHCAAETARMAYDGVTWTVRWWPSPAVAVPREARSHADGRRPSHAS
jgi:SAM-dependent methyltransferase